MGLETHAAPLGVDRGWREPQRNAMYESAATPSRKEEKPTTNNTERFKDPARRNPYKSKKTNRQRQHKQFAAFGLLRSRYNTLPSVCVCAPLPIVTFASKRSFSLASCRCSAATLASRSLEASISCSSPDPWLLSLPRMWDRPSRSSSRACRKQINYFRRCLLGTKQERACTVVGLDYSSSP